MNVLHIYTEAQPGIQVVFIVLGLENAVIFLI